MCLLFVRQFDLFFLFLMLRPLTRTQRKTFVRGWDANAEPHALPRASSTRESQAAPEPECFGGLIALEQNPHKRKTRSAKQAPKHPYPPIAQDKHLREQVPPISHELPRRPQKETSNLQD